MYVRDRIHRTRNPESVSGCWHRYARGLDRAGLVVRRRAVCLHHPRRLRRSPRNSSSEGGVTLAFARRRARRGWGTWDRNGEPGRI